MAAALSMVVLGLSRSVEGVVDAADEARLCGIGEMVVGYFDAWFQRFSVLDTQALVRLIIGCDLDIGYMW